MDFYISLNVSLKSAIVNEYCIPFLIPIGQYRVDVEFYSGQWCHRRHR